MTQTPRTYIDKAQDAWENMRKEDRIDLVNSLGYESAWANAFDLYGDMPRTLSDRIVQHFALSNPKIPWCDKCDNPLSICVCQG